jgi:hypothetical protein
MRLELIPCCTILVALAFATPIARAQLDQDELGTEGGGEADVLITAAREAAEAGRLDDAADYLRQALDDTPRPAVAFNLSLVLRDAGKIVEAVEVVDSLLSGRWGDVPPDRQTRAQEIRAELSALIATLVVRVSGAERATLEVDGDPVADAVSGTTLRLQVNPGEHDVRAQAEGMQSITRSVRSISGRSATVSFALEPDRSEEMILPATDPVSDAPDEGSGVSPWIFVAIGAAALLVGGAIALGVVLSGQSEDPMAPLPENYLGRVETLLNP